MISGHGFKDQDIFDIITLIIVAFFILVGIYAIYINIRKEHKSHKYDKRSPNEFDDR